MSFDLSPEDARKITTIIEAFERYCIGEVNVTYERYNFNKRVQETGESFDVYLGDLRKLIKSCDYGNWEDSIIRDRIVIGLRDDATRKKLLQIRSLDLKQAIDICRSSEIANRQMKCITGTSDDSINAVSSRSSRFSSQHANHRANNVKFRDRSKTPINNCKFCGKRHMLNKSDCPAYGKLCIV